MSMTVLRTGQNALAGLMGDSRTVQTSNRRHKALVAPVPIAECRTPRISFVNWLCTVRLALAMLLLGMGSSLALAQSCGFQPGDGVAGVQGTVNASAVFPNGDIVVGGSFSVAGNVVVRNIARYSPVTNSWSRVGNGVGGTVRTMLLLPSGDILAGGLLTSTSGALARYSPGTDTWSDVPGAPVGTINALALLPSGEVLVGGVFSGVNGAPAVNLAGLNPTSNIWTPVSTSSTASIGAPTVWALAVLESGDVVVAGRFTSIAGTMANNIARYSPVSGTWSAFGAGVSDTSVPDVRCLSVLPDGDLAVGGYFSTAGGVPRSGIARLRPSTSAWSALSDFTGSAVTSMVSAPDGTLYLAGSLTRAVPLGSGSFALYRPASNSTAFLSSSLGTPNSLAVLPGGDLLVGGTLSSLPTTGQVGVFRLNPVSGAVSNLGTAGLGAVTAVLGLPGGDALVGRSALATPSPRVDILARLNASTGAVTPILASSSGSVNALAALPSGEVLVGGRFTITVNGVTVFDIARYNPATGAWAGLQASQLTAFSLPVNAIAVLPNQDIIVGGAFSNTTSALSSPTPPRTALTNLARFSPATQGWYPLGGGVDGPVHALAATPAGDVYVGGNFARAGGAPSASLARYTPATDSWSPVSLGLNGAVTALSVLPGGDLLVCGSFTSVLGSPAQGAVRFRPSDGTWTIPYRAPTGIRALASLPGGDLLAGGASPTGSSGFVARYQVASDAFATITDPSSSILIGGTGVISVGVTEDGTALVGGEFLLTAPVVARNFARFVLCGAPPEFTQNPTGFTACLGGSTTVTAAVRDDTSSPRLAWESFNVNDPDPRATFLPVSAFSGPITGTPLASPVGTSAWRMTPQVTLGGRGPQVYRLRCVASSSFGTSVSREAIVTLCPADVDCSGTVDVADIFGFLNLWFARSPRVDFNRNAKWDIDEFFSFMSHWFSGC